MKKLLIPLTILTVVILTATAVSAAVLSPGLDVIAMEMEMTVSALEGETVTFSPEQFADAVGAGEYDSIMITALPDESEGTLYYGDVGVTEGQVIRSTSVSKLRFEPAKEVKSTSFGFTFDDSYSMTCNVLFTDRNNKAPTVLESHPMTAFVSSVTGGEMRAVDSDKDKLYYEIVDYPEGGNVKFDSKTGEFTYTAGSRVMKDSFTYRVKDSMGNVSKTETMTINVIENNSKTVLNDMKESEYVCAAVTMIDKGYMTCSTDKGKTYFSPDEEVSRLDFLVTAMNVFGADKVPEIENTGFADDSAIPEKYKGYVYSAAKLDIISGVKENGEICFMPDRPVTKAEASVILNNIIGYDAVTVDSLEGVPVWADEAVSAMYELGIYDLEGGAVECTKTLTKESAADMLYKVMCLIGE